MTFRISKYTHNAWKAPQEHKNPQTFLLKRFSYINIINGIFVFLGLVFTFRFLAKKLINENIVIKEKVIISIRCLLIYLIL